MFFFFGVLVRERERNERKSNLFDVLVEVLCCVWIVLVPCSFVFCVDLKLNLLLRGFVGQNPLLRGLSLVGADVVTWI